MNKRITLMIGDIMITGVLNFLGVMKNMPALWYVVVTSVGMIGILVINVFKFKSERQQEKRIEDIDLLRRYSEHVTLFAETEWYDNKKTQYAHLFGNFSIEDLNRLYQLNRITKETKNGKVFYYESY